MDKRKQNDKKEERTEAKAKPYRLTYSETFVDPIGVGEPDEK